MPQNLASGRKNCSHCEMSGKQRITYVLTGKSATSCSADIDIHANTIRKDYQAETEHRRVGRQAKILVRKTLRLKSPAHPDPKRIALEVGTS
jgi:hypothetical protein